MYFGRVSVWSVTLKSFREHLALYFAYIFTRYIFFFYRIKWYVISLKISIFNWLYLQTPYGVCKYNQLKPSLTSIDTKAFRLKWRISWKSAPIHKACRVTAIAGAINHRGTMASLSSYWNSFEDCVPVDSAYGYPNLQISCKWLGADLVNPITTDFGTILT